MINSQEYQAPNSDISKGMRDINNAIVDSGYRFGTQVYKFILSQKGSVYPNSVDLATNSNGLSVDVAGVSVAVVFNTDTETTISDFITALIANANITNAKLLGVNGNVIEISVVENKEVLIDSPSVTGATVEVIPTVELVADLRIVPAVVTINNEPEALRIDTGSPAGTNYYGYAELGTANSDALWRIKKVVTTGTVTEVTYADGNKLFDNVWDDRATLSYS